jgi:hypothetical protein
MPDGSHGEYKGVFKDGFDAVIQVMTDFPTAKRISAIDIAAKKEQSHD